jgi:disulfide bond formation protein DsbB
MAGTDMTSLSYIPASRLILTLGVASAGLLAGAWWFELWVGLVPCKLCLEQRQPHYAVLGLSVAAILILAVLERANARMAARLGVGVGTLLILTLFLGWSAWLGAYHSGVEWGWFAGPNDCGGAVTVPAASMPDFMKQLQGVRVVSCTEAAWRLAGLSLAGWNALFSLALAGGALAGTVITLRRIRL